MTDIRLRFVGFSMVSLILSLIVACAVSPPAPTPTPIPTAQSLIVPTAPSVAAPTSATPRQHHGEQIEGLPDAVDAPHFIDSFPNHSQTLVQSPSRIGINFDIALTADSTITLERAGTVIATEPVEFDPRRIYMSVRVPPALGDGLYLAKYRACFQGMECSDGRIGFQVENSRLAQFKDLTGQSDVTIHLQDITYQPHQIIISQGTRVTWVNDDPFDHFVNSDPHPSHNAFPELNSLDIPPTETFSYVFEEPGEYAYHCSAHVPQNMFGTILVVPTSEPAPTPTQVALASTPEPTGVLIVSPTIAPPTETAPTAIPTTEPPATPTTQPVPAKADESTLPPHRIAAHYVSSSPAHADLLSAVPSQIQINFDFVLARNSNINVRKDGEKLTLGDLVFSENRLQMSVPLPNAGGGTYHVLYRACWPDKSCHDGEFAFVVQ